MWVQAPDDNLIIKRQHKCLNQAAKTIKKIDEKINSWILDSTSSTEVLDFTIRLSKWLWMSQSSIEAALQNIQKQNFIIRPLKIHSKSCWIYLGLSTFLTY